MLRRVIWLSAIVIAACISHQRAAGQSIPDAERAALEALYNATDGPNWIRNNGWMETDPSTWQGVTIADSHVTRLDLAGNNLRGRMPDDIAALTRLEVLNVARDTSLVIPLKVIAESMPLLRHIYARVTMTEGPIPEEIGQLENLQTLQLTRSGLTGTIPDGLRQLKNLRTLQLGANQLTGEVPSWIGELTELRSLSLDNNRELEGTIPESITDLSNLVTLGLSSLRSISGGLPAGISKLTRLKNLFLSWSTWTEPLPEELFEMRSVSHLALSGLQLESISPKLLDMDSVRVLRINSNLLTEAPNFSSMKLLEQLHAQSNYLEFDSMEPWTAIDSVRLFPQRALPKHRTTVMPATYDLNCQPQIGGSANSYQWQFLPVGDTEWQDLPDEVNNTLSLPGVQSGTHRGYYRVLVRNPIFPGAQLVTNRFLLGISNLEPQFDHEMVVSFSGFEPLGNSDFKLVSMPGLTSYELPTVVSVAGTSSGTWYAYRDNGSDSMDRAEYLESYSDDPNSFRFEAGSGFWFAGADGVRLTADQTTPSVTVDGDGFFTLPVKSGWNIIGNPYDAPLRWRHVGGCLIDDGPRQPILAYNPVTVAFDTAAYLEPYHGYYYFHEDDAPDVRLRYRPTVVDTSVAPTERPDLAIQLFGPQGGPAGSVSFSLSKTRTQLVMPPMPSRLSMAITTKEVTGRGNRFFKVGITDREELLDYFLIVDNPTDRSAVLRLSPSARWSGASPGLIDTESGQRYSSMEEIFAAPGQTRFQVIPHAEAEQTVPLPASAVLWPLYPNPAADNQVTASFTLGKEQHVEVTLYTVLGRRVKTLVSDVRSAGRHELTIQPRDLDLASGVYLVRLESDQDSMTRKMIVAG